MLVLESLTRDGIICQSKGSIWGALTEGQAAKYSFCGFFKQLTLGVCFNDLIVVGFYVSHFSLAQNVIYNLVFKNC